MGPPGASVSGPPVRVLCALCSVLEACWGQGSYCWEEGTGLTPRGGSWQHGGWEERSPASEKEDHTFWMGAPD